MPRIVETATILAGETMSSVIDLSDGTAIFLHMPPDWTPANLTFQASPDNVYFSDLVDEHGVEIAVAVRADTTMRIPGSFSSSAAGWLKLRSGSRDYPVPQQADRVITISGVTGVTATTGFPA